MSRENCLLQPTSDSANRNDATTNGKDNRVMRGNFILSYYNSVIFYVFVMHLHFLYNLKHLVKRVKDISVARLTTFTKQISVSAANLYCGYLNPAKISIRIEVWKQSSLEGDGMLPA